MIRLFTDTSANLPPHLISSYQITILPFPYTINGIEAENDRTGFFNGTVFYGAMRSGALIKTSMVNVDAFIKAFTPALEAGDDILYVGMSGGISGTAAAAVMATRELQPLYPKSSIFTIDTFAASLGEGLLVLEAAALIAEGVPLETICHQLLQSRDHMCQFFTVSDLKYLKRGGRISGTEAFFGTVLQIKPLLRGDEIGRIVLYDKVRGEKNAMEALIKQYRELALDKNQMVGIAHADNEPAAKQLLCQLRAAGLTGKCLTVCYEPVTGSHVGPGALALFFPGAHK